MLEMMYSTEALHAQIKKGHTFIVLERGNEVLGFASFEANHKMEPGLCKLHKLYLLPEEKGKGLGTSGSDAACKTTGSAEDMVTCEPVQSGQGFLSEMRILHFAGRRYQYWSGILYERLSYGQGFALSVKTASFGVLSC
jgi:hypothetical protein